MGDTPIYVAKPGRIWRTPASIAQLRSRLRGRLGRLVPERTPPSAAVLSYRFLARQVDVDLPRTGGGRTILMSASVPQASSNEATLMFAHAMVEELGLRVLIVDSTFGEAGVGAVLGHAGAPGLIDFVHNAERSLIDLVQPTPRRNVSVLPAGRARIGGTQLIDADRVATLYAEACGQFDYVLLQQGPIVEDTRYLVFAAKADLILVLVEERVTPVHELDHCLDVFGQHQISSLRLVLCEPH